MPEQDASSLGLASRDIATDRLEGVVLVGSDSLLVFQV